jgi:3-isopropylmalate/(R)-2-methylmalate dehydratase small subunit
MAIEKITSVAGTAIYVPGSDIDTDRIIPARFMKCVTFDGLGQYLFYDVRKDKNGNDTAHVLNDPKFSGASILLAGVNFGCGSSREHAPQSLYRYGFRAIVARSFAEIFYSNCQTLGIPALAVNEQDWQQLIEAVNANPELEVEVDVVNLCVRFGDKSVPGAMPKSTQEALVTGTWDPIDELKAHADAVAQTASKLGYLTAKN